ncbi:MAG: 50S ribosomal protein L29 [Desulfovibrionaceae bacterium]
MKIEDIRLLSQQEIHEKLVSLRKELLLMRCNHATAQLKNTASLPKARRLIARMETLLHEKRS